MNCKTKINFLNLGKECNAVEIIRPPPQKKYPSKRKNRI